MEVSIGKPLEDRSSNLLIGMDEAGRGPVIGPLVIGLAVIRTDQLDMLRSIGVMDSKSLDHEQRLRIGESLEDTLIAYGTIEISASEIDDWRENDITLNEIEVRGFRELLREFDLKDEECILQVDAADVDEERFGNNFTDLIGGRIVSEHKADSIYPIVSAASIVAKNRRDERMWEINEEMQLFDKSLPVVGSGYPNKVSNTFLEAYYRKYSDFPDSVRSTWVTARKIRNLVNQQDITKYF